MSVKTTDNTNKVKNDLKIKLSVFLRLMADEIVSISGPNTPKKEGNLRRDIVKQVLGLRGQIRWEKNYAARMETVQFKNYTTPGTGPHFAENAVKSASKKIKNVARKAGIL